MRKTLKMNNGGTEREALRKDKRIMNNINSPN